MLLAKNVVLRLGNSVERNFTHSLFYDERKIENGQFSAKRHQEVKGQWASLQDGIRKVDLFAFSWRWKIMNIQLKSHWVYVHILGLTEADQALDWDCTKLAQLAKIGLGQT